MAEYSRFARGTFVSSGAAQAIYLPFTPQIIRMTNYTEAATPAQNGVPFANWDVSMGQGGGIMQIFNATPVLTTDNITTNGFSTFSAGLMLQYGAAQQIVGLTKASPAEVTVTAHGYSTGDVVILDGLYQSATTGMPQIAGMPFVITVTAADTFTIPWNTNQSAYTALSGSPTGASVRKILYPFLYAPGVSYISAITLAATTTIDTTAPHNLVVGSQVGFRIPSAWGTTQLNPNGNASFPGQLQTGYVTSVTDANTVVVNINSAAFTAFNSNQAVASVAGQGFPQMVAVGDVNSGGVAYSGGNLYPSPVVNGVSTINGPAISGAFVNNTRQGFYIGAGAGRVLTTASLVGASGNVIYWKASLSDLAVS